jgi:hypothetical protein
VAEAIQEIAPEVFVVAGLSSTFALADLPGFAREGRFAGGADAGRYRLQRD